MNALILTPEQLATLAGLNSTGDLTRQLNPVPLPNGNHALNADLLGDCAPGQTWEHYADFLQALPVAAVTPEDLPTTELV